MHRNALQLRPEILKKKKKFIFKKNQMKIYVLIIFIQKKNYLCYYLNWYIWKNNY